MSIGVGSTRGVVLSLQAFREGERRPAMLRVESGIPTSSYEDASSSEKLAQAPGLAGLTRWTGSTPNFESISAAHKVAPAFTEQSYEFDSRRFEAAKAALGQGLQKFRDFASKFELLLIQHAAYMVGFEGTYNDMYAANQRGELTFANFRRNATSPYQDELLAGLLAFQVGMESPHTEIVRDSIVLGAKTVANLSFMADHPDVAEGAQAIIASANMFPYHYDNPADTALVADALSTMTAAVPALSSSINDCAFQLGAGKIVAFS